LGQQYSRSDEKAHKPRPRRPHRRTTVAVIAAESEPVADRLGRRIAADMADRGTGNGTDRPGIASDGARDLAFVDRRGVEPRCHVATHGEVVAGQA